MLLVGGQAVACAENEALARFIWEKREAMAAVTNVDCVGEVPPKKKEKLDATLSKALRNVCDWKDPICSLRDARQVKGVGQWMLKMLKEFFVEEQDEAPTREACHTAMNKPKRRYVPQKGSAPYAILVTLYRVMQQGREFMKKQELIDAADASGLSRMQIEPMKCSGPSTQFGYSTKDWYSGWSSMKTLISKGLVCKSSCPAKYMLTEEGKITAKECLQRSGIWTTMDMGGGLEDYSFALSPVMGSKEACVTSADDDASSDSSPRSWTLKRTEKTESLAGLKKCSTVVSSAKKLGKRKQAHTMQIDDTSAGCLGALETMEKVDDRILSFSGSSRYHGIEKLAEVPFESQKSAYSQNAEEDAKIDNHKGLPSSSDGDISLSSSRLHLPPLRPNETFSETYDVILVLDDRERFNGKGNASTKFAEQLKTQFQINVEIRHLPIGDTLWTARRKTSKEEYVLDFIIERKKVSDLLNSIRDTRYKQQKLRLMRCGLGKLIYIVEGDPNVIDSAESIKTACFTTEIAEGFDVQRTQDMRDTLRKYGHLTHVIALHYNVLSKCHNSNKYGLCRTYSQFVEYCKNLEKERVSDVFGVMLMQVKQVTENIALSILEKYPTPLSLLMAYSKLEGDERAREQLLKGIPILNENKEISAVISKKVYRFFCSQDTE